MNHRVRPLLRIAALLLVTAAAVEAAMVAGSSVYAKRFETPLLAEPQPLAKANSKVEVGRKLRVDEVRGKWLRVSDGGASGWVFNGNITDTKPVEIKGLDGLPIDASSTSATAAARGLDDFAKEYASAHNLNNAYSDFEWLSEECQNITPEDIEDFLQKQKKGEYQ